MTLIDRQGVWSVDTSEVVMAPNSNALLIEIPTGCTGLEFSNTGGGVAYVTPDNLDVNSGREIPIGGRWYVGLQGAPVMYLATDNIGAVTVTVVRFFD